MTALEFVTRTSVKLISSNASDNFVAMAAWVSNGQDSEARLEDRRRVKGVINFLMRKRHTSPFEHGQFMFKVDVPLFVAREFHRHRTMSYNEISGRYTDMEPRFYIPSSTRPLVQDGKIGDYIFTPGEDEQYAILRTTMERQSAQAYEAYENLMGQGIAREVARQVLPLNLMTQFYATVNPLNLMKFLDLRTDLQAMYEIRQVATDMEAIFAEQMPLSYEAWNKHRHANTVEPREPAAIEVGPSTPTISEALRGADLKTTTIDIDAIIKRLQERWKDEPKARTRPTAI